VVEAPLPPQALNHPPHERIHVPTLTVDHARALAGPAWLRDRRVAAAEQLTGVPMPTTEEEVWRYSRIAELDLESFSPPATPGASLERVDGEVGVVTVDGVSGSVRVSDALAARGVTVSVAGDEEALGAVMAAPADRFALLNDAFAASPVVVRVPRGVVLPEPVVVRHHVTTDGVAAFPRLVVVAGEDSELTLLEHFTSADVRALVVPVLELQAAPAARVRYLAVNDLGPRVWMIGHQVAAGDKDSSTLLSTVALGGDYARVRTESRLVGTGAEARQIAVYFGEGTQMHDFRTLQEHVAPKTTSDLLFKGVVQDHARSVYTGLIHIGKHAKGAAAFQTNRNIKLSEGAWAESVPNLDIENNDVRCSHASAVGPIDEEQRFYLESRGVPPSVAERLIVLGFFNEVIDRLPVPAVAETLRRQVAAKLDRRTA
jgi:Fe-S cluster assembly protein SufD